MPGKIIILNGASSAGKTSLLRALQVQLAEPFLDAGIDKFIWMLPERYLERPLWDDVLGLAIESGQTGHRLFLAMHRAIAALSTAGMNVVADHVLVEPEWARDCANLLGDLPAYLIGVHCSLEVLVERERSRKNRTLGQAAAQFPVVHAYCAYDCVVDTSRFSADECAHQVIQHIESREPFALRRMRDEFLPKYSPQCKKNAPD